MISAPIDLNNPWLVGITTGVIVIVVQAIYVGVVWYWRWKGPRGDIPPRTIKFIRYMSYALSKSLVIKNDILFIHDQMGNALGNIEEEKQVFSDFMSIFSNTVPHRWAVKMSSIADHISLASNHAARAKAAWPTLHRGDVEESHAASIGDHFVTGIGEVKGGHKTFSGRSKEEIEWKQFSHDLSICIDHLMQACKEAGDFRKRIMGRKLRDIESGNHKDIHSVIQLLDESNHHFTASLSLIKKGRLNRLRTASAGEPT